MYKVPKILTKRILVTPTTVGTDPTRGDAPAYDTEIDLLIKESDDYSWFQSGDYKKYIKFHILEFCDENSSFGQELSRKIYDPAGRLKYMSDLVKQDNNYRNVDLHSVQDCIEHLGYIYGIGHYTFSLHEAINEFSQEMISITTSDLVSNASDASLETEPFDYLITRNFTSFRFGKEDKISDLSFICFCHIDIAALLEDYDVDPWLFPEAIVELNSIGGEAIYDIVLKDGVVPPTKKIFTHLEDPSKIYTGPVHKHPTPTSDGWVGYMAGASHDPNTQQQRLMSKVVPNKKIKFLEHIVISKYFGGDPLYSDEPHKGNYPFNALGESSEDKDYSFTSFQRSLDVLSRKQIDSTNNSLSSAMKRFLIESKENTDINTFYEVSKGYFGDSYMIFGFDYYNAIKNNSTYGYLLDTMEPSLRNTILNKSKILSLSVYRKRVTDSTTGIGVFGRNEHKILDTNEPVELIVQSLDSNIESYSNKLSAKIQTKQEKHFHAGPVIVGSIKEKSILIPDEPNIENYRSFFVNDYSLGSLDNGTYTYHMEVLIKDAIKEELMLYLQEYRQKVSLYKKLVLVSSIPASKYRQFGLEKYDTGLELGNTQDQTREQVVDTNTSGNYDTPPPAYNYDLKKFTPEYKDWLSKSNYSRTTEDAVQAFIDMLSVFSNQRDSTELTILKNNIMRNVDITMDCTIQDCEKFLLQLQDMESLITNVLGSDAHQPGNISVNHDPTGRSAGSRSPNIINIIKDFKVPVVAERKSIMVDHLTPNGSRTLPIAAITRQSSLDRQRLGITSELGVTTPSAPIIYPERFMSTGRPRGTSAKSIHIADVKKSGSLRSAIKKKESEYVKQNLVLDTKSITRLSNLKQSKIKHGLDGINKKSKAKNIGNRSTLYSEPYSLSDYNSRLEGLSVGLVGYGVSQAYKKVVNLKENTITHENFSNLLSEAVYLNSLGDSHNTSLNRLLKENEKVLNIPKFKQYINLLNVAFESTSFSAKVPNTVDKEIKNPKREEYKKNDSNMLKDRYVTSNPAVIKIRTKISTINKSGEKPKENYKVYSTSDDLSMPASYGSPTGKKVMIAKIEPIVQNSKNIGKIHSHNDFEVVNSLLLVEV